MNSSKRTPGFWATVGVEYNVRHSGSDACWCARLPRRADLSGYGTTKPEALANLKSAYGWANRQPKQRLGVA